MNELTPSRDNVQSRVLNSDNWCLLNCKLLNIVLGIISLKISYIRKAAIKSNIEIFPNIVYTFDLFLHAKL